MSARLFSPMARIFTAAFGEATPCIWVPAGGAPVAISSYIFNIAHAPVGLDGVAIDDPAPTAWIPSGLVPGMRRDDRLIVGGTDYAVESCKADGRGMSEVSLSHRSP